MIGDTPENEAPPHHSRPELFEAIAAHDQKTELLKKGHANISTFIVGDPQVVEIAENWHLGYRLDDRFEIVEIRGGKGSSGMGIVFIVEDDRGGRHAVKTLQRRFRRELYLLRRFVREARTWMLAGDHPNIVRAERLEIIEAAPCLFIEWVPSDEHGAHSVAQRLARGPLSVAETLDVAHQCCQGMCHATRAVPGLVHRDLKPENLLSGPDGIVKITDFGLVRTQALADDSLEQWAQSDLFTDLPQDITHAGTIFGTPAYMAPEQFTRAGEVDFRADIYALGCCLYECLTGLPPFIVPSGSTIERLLAIKRMHLVEPPRPLREVMGAACPPALDALIRRCLAKDPRERWRSYEELGVAVLSLMDSLGLHPREIPDPSPTPAEIAAQMRSISLLEGYDQAIHMRKLREGQEESPYAFHLALASYFHCAGDRREEEEQLSKALSVRGASAGYEAVRRLADLWIRQGHAPRADALLKAWRQQMPDALEHVLEPAVRAACACGRTDDALDMIAPFPDNFRTQLLRAEIMRARDDCGGLRALLDAMRDTLLAETRRKIAGIAPGAVVGWGREGDRDAFIQVLAEVDPGLDTRILTQTGQAIWPDIGGYPDFAPEVAWLSYVFGEIAAMENGDSGARQADHARTLGYPGRLEDHLERDEYWFWMRESQFAKPRSA
ncbi:MAG: protein kinase [Candidatus Hydrogenedentes bacterium]|nr:protein kinase [Candidatus Hydrogenedentota bacterium]